MVGHTCSLRLGRTKCSCINNCSGRMLCSKITSVTTTAIIATKTPRRTPETNCTRQASQTPCPHIPQLPPGRLTVLHVTRDSRFPGLQMPGTISELIALNLDLYENMFTVIYKCRTDGYGV